MRLIISLNRMREWRKMRGFRVDCVQTEFEEEFKGHMTKIECMKIFRFDSKSAYNAKASQTTIIGCRRYLESWYVVYKATMVRMLEQSGFFVMPEIFVCFYRWK